MVTGEIHRTVKEKTSNGISDNAFAKFVNLNPPLRDVHRDCLEKQKHFYRTHFLSFGFDILFLSSLATNENTNIPKM